MLKIGICNMCKNDDWSITIAPVHIVVDTNTNDTNIVQKLCVHTVNGQTNKH